MTSLTKFIVDEMLENLARWLRILGFDTLSASSFRKENIDVDKAILRIAMKDDRILLTSDKQLASRANKMGLRAMYIEPNLSLKEVLRKILENLNIREEAHRDMLSRCPLCNGILVPANKEDLTNKVPPSVLKIHNEFWICNNCGHVYWIGSHFKNINKVLSEVL